MAGLRFQHLSSTSLGTGIAPNVSKVSVEAAAIKQYGGHPKGGSR